ncbi:MAG: manganese efflux pump MntP [Candidatus Cyclobacteriaceae bacterium M2_1C_046]
MLLKLLFSGLVIGSNNLAAALTIGSLGGKDQRTRIIIVFGAFEFLMPLIGVWLGEEVSEYVGEAASGLSVVILLALATTSFYAAAKPPETDKTLVDKITTWKGLILLELGLSLDNFGAGFGLGVDEGELSPWLLAVIVAAFSISYTWIGLSIGDRVAKKYQDYAEAGAGVLLTLLAALLWFDIL